VAVQSGRHAARQIARLATGQPTEPFSYFDKGMMAVIGRNAAVVQVRRLRLTGRLAWLAWGFLHVGYLPRTVNRASTALKYLWWHLTHENVHRVLIETEQDKTPVS
jgi:NADH dehydrogenase